MGFRANDYARNKIQSPWKAMLLNNVLAGLEYVTQVSEPYLTGPPSGYDSVCTFFYRQDFLEA